MYLWPWWLSSLGKMSIPVLSSFSKSAFSFVCLLLLSCMNSLYIWDSNPLSDIWFANIFSSVGCPFLVLMVSFAAEAFWFNVGPLVCFCFCCLSFWFPISKNHCYNQCVRTCSWSYSFCESHMLESGNILQITANLSHSRRGNWGPERGREWFKGPLWVWGKVKSHTRSSALLLLNLAAKSLICR